MTPPADQSAAAREKAQEIVDLWRKADLLRPHSALPAYVAALANELLAAGQQGRDAGQVEGAEAMREAVLSIGITNDDLIAVGKALLKYIPGTPTNEELGAAAFDAGLRLQGSFKKRVRAIRASATEPDPRDPDHTREGIFVYHNCARCLDGKRPCVKGNPSQCEFPHARND